MDCRAYCFRMKEARVPASCSLMPATDTTGGTGTQGVQAFGISYSIVKTPHVHF